MPDDADELAVARFCRHCGAAYFGDEPEAVKPVAASRGSKGKEDGRRRKEER
jgi:hypothetical protein